MADEPRAPDTGDAGAGETPKKRSSGSYAWLWMLLALASVGGFLAWLGTTAEPTSVAVVEEEDETVMDPPSIPVVSKDTLADDKARFIAQEIRVHNVAITGTLGERVFWGELGDQTTQIPILVRLDSAVAAGDSVSGPFTPDQGAFYSVRGRTFPMSDSIAEAWGDEGEFAGEGEQMQAMFTDYYMQVNDIRPTPASLRESTPRPAQQQDTTGATAGSGAGTSEGDSEGA